MARLLLLLLSLLVGSNARRCCTQDFFFNTTTEECEAHTSLNYTSLLVNDTGIPAPPDCTIPEDTCFGVINETLVNVGCNQTSSLGVEPRRLRVCCPHGHMYSRELHSCMAQNDSERIEPGRLVADIIRDEFALLVHGPLDLCRLDNAIVDLTIKASQVILDESESGFHVQGHPELTGDKCLAVQDDDLVVRVCMPKEFACSSGRVCHRRCCPDGMAYYGNVGRCRPKWQSFPLEIYQRKDSDINLTRVEAPGSYAILHGIICKKIIIDSNETNPQWHVLNDGKMLRWEDKVLMDNNQFCVEYTQWDRSPHGLTGFMCGIEEGPMNYIKATGFIFSCLFLVLTIIVYLIVPRLYNLHGKTLISYAFWLLVLYILTCSMHLVSMSTEICSYIGYGIYFSFLCAASWLNVRCFDIWWTIGRSSRSGHTSQNSKRQMERHRFFMYFLYATGLPIIITSIAILAQHSPEWVSKDYRPNIAEDGKCFFSEMGHGKLIYYVIPLALMFSANTIFFILTVRNFLKIRNEIEKMQDTNTTEERKKQKLHNDKAKFVTNAKLFVVMGVVWMFEVFSANFSPDHWCWYLSDMVNAFHGLLIFVIYVCKKNIFKELNKVLNKTQDMKTSSTGTISTSTTSTAQTAI